MTPTQKQQRAMEGLIRMLRQKDWPARQEIWQDMYSRNGIRHWAVQAAQIMGPDELLAGKNTGQTATGQAIPLPDKPRGCRQMSLADSFGERRRQLIRFEESVVREREQRDDADFSKGGWGAVMIFSLRA